MKRIVTAPWVLPVVAPPLRHGAVLVDQGTVLEAGPLAELRARHPGLPVETRENAVLLPGLVNAHTHLSLTELEPPRDRGFFGWLLATAHAARALSADAVREGVRKGVEASWSHGTVAVGEIATRPEGVEEIARDGRLRARVYFEFLGLSAEPAHRRFEDALALADRLRREHPDGSLLPGLSPHAPYSVRPELWRETATAARERDLFWSTHLAEAPGEDRFLRRGDGPVRDYLETLGVWDGTFPVPGRGAMDLLSLDRRALLVHGVHLEPAAMDVIAGSGAFLCLCPRSNAALSLPLPPAADLHARGIPLVLGTDSLASNEDLSVWGEMRALARLAPGIPAGRILGMATVNGARALGLNARPDLAGWPWIAAGAADLGAADPAEYLVREPAEPHVESLI